MAGRVMIFPELHLGNLGYATWRARQGSVQYLKMTLPTNGWWLLLEAGLYQIGVTLTWLTLALGRWAWPWRLVGALPLGVCWMLFSPAMLFLGWRAGVAKQRRTFGT